VEGVNPGHKRGFGVVLCKLCTLVAFITAAVDAICSTTVPVGTRLHWSTDSPACMDRLRRDGQCCGREAQCGQLTTIKLDKDYSPQARVHFGIMPACMYRHTTFCSHELSTGPQLLKSLSSWWPGTLWPSPDGQSSSTRPALCLLLTPLQRTDGARFTRSR